MYSSGPTPALTVRMAQPTITEGHLIGGIRTRVYKTSTIARRSTAVVFLLHGRHGSQEDVDSFARSLLHKESENMATRGLYIVTLDHRNHGGRMIERRANNTWAEENEFHSMDMYSIQVGTTRDITFLCDFLPTYLFPHGESKVDAWGVVGISLGGHSTWLALTHEPRVTVGVPIIGCPDYMKLMEYRSKTTGISLEGRYIPESLVKLIERLDPASTEHTSREVRNPFVGKKILVVSGEKDMLVPWIASKDFVDELEVGAKGLKEVFVQKGAGHECTEEMKERAAEFVKQQLLIVEN